MRAEDLLKILREQPFAPFRMRITDGRSYDIRHPDQALVLQRMVIVGVPGHEGFIPSHDYHTVTLLHITGTEPLAPAVSSTSPSQN